MKKELNKTVKQLDLLEFKVNIEDPDLIERFAELNFIRISEFDFLFKSIQTKFLNTKKIGKQLSLLDDEKFVYIELSKHLKNLIIGIKSSKTKLIILCPKGGEKEIDLYLTKILKLDSELNFEEKIKQQVLNKLHKQLKEANEQIFILNNYQFPIYKKEDFLGSNFYLNSKKNELIYKKLIISNCGSRISILYKDESQKKDRDDFLNIISFIQAIPNFIITENRIYNEKLTTIYSEFDILDLISLRNNKFFNSSKSKIKILRTPIFKPYKETNIVLIPNCSHLELFKLYHSSLKQIEPLPRCIFLFRIVEYGKNYQYQPAFKPSKVELKDIIEYYYKELLNHRFIPLYFLDHGTDWDYKNNIGIEKRKTQYLNFITVLKKESKKILKQWKCHSYLKNKSLGEIIYKTGRNAVAHGGNGKQNINYDYANKYKHINDVNIFLELIARYLIEIHNPKLKDVVFRKKNIYERNCSILNNKIEI